MNWIFCQGMDVFNCLYTPFSTQLKTSELQVKLPKIIVKISEGCEKKVGWKGAKMVKKQEQKKRR